MAKLFSYADVLFLDFEEAEYEWRTSTLHRVFEVVDPEGDIGVAWDRDIDITWCRPLHVQRSYVWANDVEGPIGISVQISGMAEFGEIVRHTTVNYMRVSDVTKIDWHPLKPEEANGVWFVNDDRLTRAWI